LLIPYTNNNNNNNYNTFIPPVFSNIQAQWRKQFTWHNHKRGYAILVIAAWNPRIFLVEKQFQTNMF